MWADNFLRTKLAFAALVFALTNGHIRGQDKPAITCDHYRIFDANGKPATWKGIIGAMRRTQVAFLGELHDDPVAHHVQAEIFRKLHRHAGKNLTLSLEMFERDVQHIVNEYLAGLITEKHFLASSRPWKSYQRDYRALVEFAKKHKLDVIAANAPRRYVNMAGRLGATALLKIPNRQLRGLPPLPYAEASPKYAARFKEIMRQHLKPAKKPKEKHKPKTGTKPAPKRKFDVKKALQAQSLWDAAMAYSIAEHLLRFPDAKIVHVNGRFHTAARLGLCDHLVRYRPGTTFVVVSMFADKSFPKFDPKKMANEGDFVIVTDPAFQKKTK